MPDPAGSVDLVVCTDHGAVNLGTKSPGSGDQGQAQRMDHPCVFCGHAWGTPPPAVAHPVAFRVVFVTAALTRAVDMIPGRGLAAPPPPSHAPPAITS
jgi:hypothetical protein